MLAYHSTKRSILSALAAVALTVIGISSAQATAVLSPQIDFRDQLFSAANYQHSFSTVIDGIAFTITAEVDGAPLGGNAKLWWDSKDGLGIRHGYENDEIEGSERLRLSFENTIGLSEIYIADMFVESGYSETGFFQIDNGTVSEFDAASLMGTDGNKGNGEHLITIDPAVPVNDIVFFSPGRIDGQNHEFALLGFTDPPLGFTDPPLPAPEPNTIAIFAFGLAWIGLTLRKRAV